MKKSALLICAGVVCTALQAAESEDQSMRRKSLEKVMQAFPYQPAKSSEPAVSETTVTNPARDSDDVVIVMKPLTVVERVNSRKLELEMRIEGEKRQAEKDRRFSIWRGGGVIYEGRMGKARFAFGVAGPIPFFALSW